MTPTTKAVLAVSLLLSPVLALDEYMPIGERNMQVDLGLSRTSITGTYQNDWSNDNVENENNPFVMPMQGKFGLGPELEGSLNINYIFVDANDHTGLDRPQLALKYADSTTGLGGFAAITLPIGFEEILDAGNFATFTIGAMYDHRWMDFGLLTHGSYSFTTQDKDDNKKDFINLFAKPGYFLPIPALTARHQDLEVNFGMEYSFWFNEQVNDESTGRHDQLFLIHPGIFYKLNRIFSAEAMTHFTLSGQNQTAYNAVEVKLFFTLDEAIYNAISG